MGRAGETEIQSGVFRLMKLAELDVHAAARRLLGSQLVRTLPGGRRMIGRIVETESYGQDDRSSHSHGGPRGRNLVMYGPAGFAYVYFTYGMHHCLNVVTGPAGRGEAVLIRALEPLEGVTIMQQNRHLQGFSLQSGVQRLCSGPGKLTQALAVNRTLDGHDLARAPLELKLLPAHRPSAITTTTRIGIRFGTQRPQRFYIKDNPWVSRR